MAKPDWGVLQQRFLSDHAVTGVSPKEWCEAQGLNYATARRHIKKPNAQTAQKTAQKKLRTAQKEKCAVELVDDDGLTAQQRRFVAEYLKDMQIYPIADASAMPLAFLTDLPATKTLAVGAALDLAVVMQGGSAPYTYVWKKGGTAIPGKTASTFNIASVVSGDAGSYTCEVTDAAGKTLTSAACAVTVS